MSGQRSAASAGSGPSAPLDCAVPRRGFSVRHPLLAAHRAQGFTLIETIAVIVLIGIVASVAAIAFSASLSSAKVQAASRDLVAALRYTRGQAIVKREQKVLELNLEDNSYQAPGKGRVELPRNMDLRLTTAQQELTSDMSGGIRFFPDGSSTGGNIAVVMGEREWKINVGWLTGEITLDKPEDVR